MNNILNNLINRTLTYKKINNNNLEKKKVIKSGNDVLKKIRNKNKKLKLINYNEKKFNNNEEQKDNEEHVKNPKDIIDLKKGLNKKQNKLLEDELDTIKKTTYNSGLTFNENNIKKIKVLEEKIEEKKKSKPDSKMINRWENQINEIKK